MPTKTFAAVATPKTVGAPADRPGRELRLPPAPEDAVERGAERRHRDRPDQEVQRCAARRWGRRG